MVQQSETRELIELIYASALEPDRWDDALRATAAALDADAALVYLPGRALTPDNYARDYIGWNVIDFDGAAEVALHTKRRDAYVELGADLGIMRPGYIGVSQHICDDRRWDENPWSELVYKAYDIRHYMGFIGNAPFKDAPAIHFSLFRRPRGTPFGDDSLNLLASLRPHLERAGRMVFCLRSEVEKTSAVKAASDALTNPVLVVDHSGGLLSANRAAEDALREAKHLRLRFGRVTAARPSSDVLLQAAIRDGIGSKGSDIWLTGDNGSRLAIAVTPLIFPSGRRAVLLFLTDSSATDQLGARLTALYGVSTAEAAVAIAVAHGIPPSEVAKSRRVKIETIRAQLRSIFDKMDVRGQTQLTRLIEQHSRSR